MPAECAYEKLEPGHFRCRACGHERRLPGLRAEQLHRHCSTAGPPPRRAPRDRGRRGPGTELKKLLAQLGIAQSPTCDCNAKAIKMDIWGIDGCREHFAEIVAWMREGQKKWGWKDKLAAAARATVTGIAFKINWSDPFPDLIQLAISRTLPVATDQPPRTIETLNLIYHIWPAALSDAWRWNLAQLLPRLHVFNGRRVIALALDDLTAPAAEVRAALAGHDVEVIECANDPRLREAATFVRLLERVETLDPTHATFYAHAKGTSRRGKVLMDVIQRWTETMYRANLDDIDRVKNSLATRAMLGVSFSCEPRWRYPGTFWWFHNASVFERDTWKKIENPISSEGPGWAVEAFPERTFAAEECASIKIHLDAPADTHRSLYSPEVWGLGCPSTLDAALARFDDADYLAMYPDVAAGVAAGDWPSGRDHFIARGFAERRPI